MPYPGAIPGPNGEILQAPVGAASAGKVIGATGPAVNGVVPTGWTDLPEPDLSAYALKAGDTFTGTINGTSIVLSGSVSVGTSPNDAHLSYDAANGRAILQSKGDVVINTEDGAGTGPILHLDSNNNKTVVYGGALQVWSDNLILNRFKQLIFDDGGAWVGLTQETYLGTNFLKATNGSTGVASVLCDTFWAKSTCAALDGNWRIATGGGFVEYYVFGGYAGHRFNARVDVQGPLNSSGDITASGRIVSTADGGLNSQAKFGSFELQSYSANNCWFGDNCYYSGDGGEFRRRADGYGNFLRYINGEMRYETLDNGSANTTQTPATRLKASRTGEFAIGGNIDTSPGSFTGGTIIGDTNQNAFFAGGITPGPSTFGLLPSASANNGASRRVTDRSGRYVYSDGTNWRWFSDDTIAS